MVFIWGRPACCDTFALHPPAKPFMMILLSIFYWEQMHPFQCITHSNDVTPSSLNRVSISYLWKHGRPIKCIQISILKRKYTSEKCDEIVLRAARSNWTVVEELLRWHQISSAITHPLFFFFFKKRRRRNMSRRSCARKWLGLNGQENQILVTTTAIYF